MKLALYLFVVFSLAVVSGCGSSSSGTAGITPVSSSSIAVSSGHLVDGNGRTLYEDGSSPNDCTTGSGCIAVWPPFFVSQSPTAASGETGTISTVVRPDGSGTQATYNGNPLYYFTGDPGGGTTGSGQGGFSLVSP
jgi:predicted lipoprotein with Yx(FWY)xxD motif